jgi:hypothetical protein
MIFWLDGLFCEICRGRRDLLRHFLFYRFGEREKVPFTKSIAAALPTLTESI